MRLLTFTNLYPNLVQPRHGVFVEHRLRQLVASGRASARVVAPVPWVPVAHRIFDRYAALAHVPERDERHGIPIWHPRFVAVPRVTSWINPVSMAGCALKTIRAMQREGGDFDLIDGHFLFPDCAAAVLLGRWLKKPVIATARGTDVNFFTSLTVPGAWIRWVGRHAAAIVTVSGALRDLLIDIGVPRERVTVLRNGVDLRLFRPRSRAAAREELGLNRDARLLLSVGHLVEDKGHQVAIEALPLLPKVNLVVIGDGPMRESLRRLAESLGVAARIAWPGTLPQERLAAYYAAADATVLASRSEGMANVLLESLACGTPVIATRVGGNAEVVCASAAGELLVERTPLEVARTFEALLRNPRSPEDVRRHAEKFNWEPTTLGLLGLIETVLRDDRSAWAKRASSFGHR